MTNRDARKAAPTPCRKPKRRFPAEVLTREEAAALMSACDASTLVGLRNRALIAVMYRSGLRVAEALSVRPKDVDIQNCAIRVLFAKGGRARTVGIDPAALELVMAWARRRLEWGAAPGAPLFCSSSGRRLTEAYVRRLLPRLGRRAGIERRVHAHGLRHTMASQLREEGVDAAAPASSAPFPRQPGQRPKKTKARGPLQDAAGLQNDPMGIRTPVSRMRTWRPGPG
jgi:site-specific recombinase XerD